MVRKLLSWQLNNVTQFSQGKALKGALTILPRHPHCEPYLTPQGQPTLYTSCLLLVDVLTNQILLGGVGGFYLLCRTEGRRTGWSEARQAEPEREAEHRTHPGSTRISSACMQGAANSKYFVIHSDTENLLLTAYYVLLTNHYSLLTTHY